MIGYTKHFESNKAMSFKVVDNKLLKKWITISSLVGTKFDSEPVFGDNDKCIKTKIKIYNGNVNGNFQGKKEPKECASCRFLSLRMLDSVVESKKKYYPETLLEECKCETKTTERENLINGDLEATSSDYETDSDFDNETNNELTMNLTKNLTMSLIINLVISLLMNLDLKRHFKSLIVCFKHALLCFYLSQSV